MRSQQPARSMRVLGLAAACLLLITAGIAIVQAESTYLGCYNDRFDVKSRDLAGLNVLDESLMTAAFCERHCGPKQFKYFGLQYGQECWCGDSYGKHGKVEPEGAGPAGCNTPCSGDKTARCGGELMNSVYEITSPYEVPAGHPDGRPLLALVMIVKNEAHTLPTTLLAIKPFIDVYYILDTGSTDGTQQAIRDTLGPNGEVWEEPFIDYGRSRNRALEIAQTSTNLGGAPVFSLMLSADETVYNGQGLRTFCEQHRDKQGGTEEAYYVQMDVGWRFDSARLSRTDRGWRYQGRVHEYLAGPDGRGAPTHRVPQTYIKFKVTDQTRRQEQEYTILRILQEEVAEKPLDTRASFYLARTYNVVGNHSASLKEFYRRVELGGWREEVYESLYAIAWQKEALHLPWWEIQQAFMDAHAYSPERAEPLYAIANHWQREREWSLAWMYASHASILPYPTSASLWVQADVYAWQCWYVMGMVGLDVRGREREGAAALVRAMAKRTGDSQMIQQMAKYRAQLGTEVVDQIECEVDAARCKTGQSRSAAALLGLLPRTPAPTEPVVESRVFQRDPHSAAAPGGAASSSNLPMLYALLVFLLVSNVLLLLAWRKNRLMMACMPQGILGAAGADKQV